MNVILEKKGFKLFFHNKELDKTLPVGWTGTLKGMLTKCKKLLRENEGSHFEYIFKDEVNFKVEEEALIKLITEAYILEINNPISSNESTDKSDIKVEELDNIIEKSDELNIPKIIPQQPKPGHLFCSSKNCNNEIEIENNLEYKHHGNNMLIVCPKCGHKTRVPKIKKTNSLSYAIGEKNRGTLVRLDGSKRHMNKKSRLRLKRREN